MASRTYYSKSPTFRISALQRSSPPTARVDRFQGRPQGDGLVGDPGRAGKQGAARQGRLEPISYMWQATDVVNAPVHFGVMGAGQRGWYGWPDVPQLEKLVTDWERATGQPRRKLLADEIQKIALSEVTYVPWGEWFQPTAFRKNVRDVLKFVAPIFWT